MFLAHFDEFKATTNLLLCIMIEGHKNYVKLMSFAFGCPHLIVFLFSEYCTFLNDFLQMMPVYPTSQILQYRRESSVVRVFFKAADFFNYREYKNELF